MKKLYKFMDFISEGLESYQFELLSDNPFLYKYQFFDSADNKYLVEFKNIPVKKEGDLSNLYELLYYVEDEGSFTVYKVVNVNPYKTLKVVFGDILNDFISRCNWAKEIFFVELAKEKEKDYITSRTKIYKRYLDMNTPKGFSVSRAGNSIQLRRL